MVGNYWQAIIIIGLLIELSAGLRDLSLVASVRSLAFCCYDFLPVISDLVVAFLAS